MILFYLHRLPLKLIKVDEATGEPLRDESGFCIQCPPNEPGEFIGKVVRGDPVKGTIIKYTYIRLLILLFAFKTLLKEPQLHRLLYLPI